MEETKRGEHKMTKISFLILCITFISCNSDFFPSSKVFSSGLADEKESRPPQVYLRQNNQLIDISELNRGKLVLSLSDQIVFSDQEAKAHPLNLTSLEDFKSSGKNLRTKISSFCSYTNPELKAETDSEVDRITQELGSDVYYSSFSIFELLPEEILFKGLDKKVYCSFVFAFKNKQGSFNYYNIAQQIINPSFSSPNQLKKLALIRETESGYYLPLGSELVDTKQNLSKVLLVNHTEKPVDHYHLYCEGLKLLDVSGGGLNAIPIFLNLIAYSSSFPEGVKECRVFSKNNRQITGMTDAFKIVFNRLDNPLEVKLDLQTAPSLKLFSMTDDKSYAIGEGISLNSHFHFDGINAGFTGIYDSLDIIVQTQCFNDKVFGEAKAVSKRYQFPFRKKFPLMAVTPEEVFAMEMNEDIYEEWLKYKRDFLYKRKYNEQKFQSLIKKRATQEILCMYQIGLKDKHTLESSVVFSDHNYFIPWSAESYGIDQDLNDDLVFIGTNLNSFNNYSSNRSYESLFSERQEQMDRPFLSLQEDIYNGGIPGFLYFNFFDTVGDRFFEMEGDRLNKMSLKCSGRKFSTEERLQFSWSYNSQQNSYVSLKSIFSNPKIKDHIEKEKLITCRVLLYENDILRYFSREMMIIQ